VTEDAGPVGHADNLENVVAVAHPHVKARESVAVGNERFRLAVHRRPVSADESEATDARRRDKGDIVGTVVAAYDDRVALGVIESGNVAREKPPWFQTFDLSRSHVRLVLNYLL